MVVKLVLRTSRSWSLALVDLDISHEAVHGLLKADLKLDVGADFDAANQSRNYF